MKTRIGLLIAGCILAAGIIFGCSKPPEVKIGKELASFLPADKFYSQRVFKPNALVSSDFYKSIKQRSAAVNRIIDDDFKFWVTHLALKPEKLMAVTYFEATEGVKGRVEFLAVEYSRAQLKEHLEQEREWDLVEAEKGDYTYYYDERTLEALLLLPSGLLHGSKASIEKAVETVGGEDEPLSDNELFKEARNLVEPTATKYGFYWREIENIRKAWKGSLSPLIQEDAFLVAVEGIVALGAFTHWSEDFESVQRVMFDSEESAEVVASGIKSNLEGILKEQCSFLILDIFGIEKPAGIERLKDKAHITANGAIVEISFKLSWEDVAEFF